MLYNYVLKLQNHKFWFSHPKRFAALCRRPLISQTMNYLRSYNLRLKNQRCKDISIRKFLTVLSNSFSTTPYQKLKLLFLILFLKTNYYQKLYRGIAKSLKRSVWNRAKNVLIFSISNSRHCESDKIGLFKDVKLLLNGVVTNSA